ncbi:phosphoribosyltransferase [Candidatus Dependentiae bacterium]
MGQIKKYYTIFIVIFGLYNHLLFSAEKEHVNAQQLLEDSFRLAKVIFESDFRPTHLIALWRGGAPIGIAIEEYFHYKKRPIEHHAAVRVSSYRENDQKEDVQVYHLEAVIKQIKSSDRLLIVDDLVDSGNSVLRLLKDIREQCGENTPKEIKVATIYHKPASASITPDYYLYETDKWVVFPHELEGLTASEIEKYKGASVARIVE